jgi:ABC-type taurine transport system substrate-binding protein
MHKTLTAPEHNHKAVPKHLAVFMVGIVTAIALVSCSSTTAGGSTASGTKPDIVVSYWQQTTPLPETILATQPSLQATIPAKLSFRSIESGPAALAALTSGSLGIVGGVGNPPVVTAIARNTNMKIIWAQYYDSAGLSVNNSVTSPSAMVGKTFGTQIGSSQDFSFHGWLKDHGLEGKVHLVDMQPNAMLAAYKTGAIAGGWVSEPFASLMAADNGRSVTTSAAMVASGYPGVNAIVANADLIKQSPKAMQAYVCAISMAADLSRASGSNEVLNKAGAYAGGKADSSDVIGLGGTWPYWPLSQQLGSKGLGSVGNPGEGLFAKVLYKTGQYLKSAGTLSAPPTMAKIAAAIDPTFAQAVVDGKCTSK